MAIQAASEPFGAVRLVFHFSAFFQRCNSRLIVPKVRGPFDCWSDPSVTNVTPDTALTMVVQKTEPNSQPAFIAALIFLSILIGTLLLATIMLLVYLRGKVQGEDESTEHAEPVNPPTEVELKKLDQDASVSMNDSFVCTICFAHRIRVRLLPCGHAFACYTCGSYFLHRECGLCRQQVSALELLSLDVSDSSDKTDTSSQSGELADSTASD